MKTFCILASIALLCLPLSLHAQCCTPLPAIKRSASCLSSCQCDRCGAGCNCAERPCGSSLCTCSVSRPIVGSQLKHNFGVDPTKRSGNGPRYWLNGEEVSREQAVRSLSDVTRRDVFGNKIPDDSALPRLTVIGSPEARKRFLDDLKSHPTLSTHRTSWLVNSYDPSHPLLARRGFKTHGNPTIYAQLPAGKVLYYSESYKGPEDLRVALDKALGRTPAPNPSPGPPNPSPGPSPSPSPSPTPSPAPAPAPLLDWLRQFPLTGYALSLLFFLYALASRSNPQNDN